MIFEDCFWNVCFGRQVGISKRSACEGVYVCFRPIADRAVNGASLAMVRAAQTLETAGSVDAACRWVLRHRADGVFHYAEYRFVDLRPDGHVDGYWEQSYTSGLFETAQAARDHALETIPWLPGQL